MPNYCEICNSEFVDEYAFHGHLLGKKHLKNVEQANYRRRLEQNSIFVSPIPPWATRPVLITFFTKFGVIQSYKFGPRYVIIEYKSRQPADFLLSQPIFMGQWKLNIRRRVLEIPNQTKREPSKKGNSQGTSDDGSEGESSDAQKLKKELEEEPTFEDQYDKFRRLVQDDDDEVEARCNEVCNSLNRCLRISFPKGNAIRFGSTVTGLQLKQSDTDVFFDTGESIMNDDDNVKTQQNKNDLKWTSKSVFKEVKNVLYKNKTIFSRVIPIPMAKTPVIKFNHIPTNSDCDITFKHDLGVHNSQLIKHYLSMDARIKPLMIIIKYWAKSLDLSGSGKITNYSLVMAIIFYLQQPSINILPTVKELQSCSEPIYNNGWLVNFDKDIISTSSENKISTPELLQGFFKFYADFNFAILLICPLDGLAHAKVDFAKVATELGGNVEALNLSKPACMQDPFQLDHNITSGWSERQLQAFQNQCAEAAKICETSAKDDYKTLLPMLCDPSLKQKSKKPKSIQTAIPAGKFKTFGLPEDFETRTNIENKEKFIANNWFLTVYKLMERIFEKIFKLEVQVMYDETIIKQKKIEEESDVHTKDHDKIMLFCRGKYCLHRSRKNRVTCLDPTLSCIEREALISDKIQEDLEQKKEETLIKFTCELEKQLNPLQIVMTLTDKQFANKSFVELSTYMISRIPNIIEKELQHMLQYKKQL